MSIYIIRERNVRTLFVANPQAMYIIRAISSDEELVNLLEKQLAEYAQKYQESTHIGEKTRLLVDMAEILNVLGSIMYKNDHDFTLENLRNSEYLQSGSYRNGYVVIDSAVETTPNEKFET